MGRCRHWGGALGKPLVCSTAHHLWQTCIALVRMLVIWDKSNISKILVNPPSTQETQPLQQRNAKTLMSACLQRPGNLIEVQKDGRLCCLLPLDVCRLVRSESLSHWWLEDWQIFSYPVILRILGFQIAPHLGSEITSSLATSIAPPKSQGSQEIYTALRKEITQFGFFS